MVGEIYTIDASGKKLGRLATEVAMKLMGKNKPDYLPYKLSNNKVIVFNVSKLVLTGNKFEDKKYWRHSGYLGGIKLSTFKEVFAKNPTKPFYLAVSRMLPKNKLRAKMIKNLKLYADDYKEQK
jgi:large subunit ribosomal protein L13